MTVKLVSLVGERGQDWQLLASGAFVSLIIPLIVFRSLQRYFVRRPARRQRQGPAAGRGSGSGARKEAKPVVDALGVRVRIVGSTCTIPKVLVYPLSPPREVVQQRPDDVGPDRRAPAARARSVAAR